MSINENIKEIIKDSNMSLNAFAKKCKATTTSLQNIVSRGSKPGSELIQKILTANPDYDANWLIMDEGSKFEKIEMKKKIEYLENLLTSKK